MRRLGLILCVFVAGLATAQPAAASTSFDLRGKWDCCGSGGAGSQIFNITQMDLGSGQFSGEATFSDGTRFSPITGTASGDSVSLTTGPYDGGSYSATFVGTISPDNTVMSGTWSSNASQSGTWTATRTGAPPAGTPTPDPSATVTPGASPTATASPSPDGRRTSAMLVGCNKQLLLGGVPPFICSAMVVDASGKPPLATPTGSVTFVLDTGAPGSFGGAARATCILKQVTAGAASSCSVTYTPGVDITTGIQPAMTAFYSGDSAVAPSSGRPTARLATVTGQIFDPQIIKLAAGLQTGCGSTAKAPAKPRPRTAPLTATTAYTLGYYSFQPNSGLLEKTLTVSANGTVFVVNVIPYCIGGATYLTGKATEFLGNDKLVGTEIAAGAISISAGFEPGGVLIPAAAVQYAAGKTVGPGLSYVGDVVLKDPPDKRFAVVAKPKRVPRVRLPGVGADGKRVLALHRHLAQAAAYAKAMATAVNRAATARKAKDMAALGLQSRAILAYDKGAARELQAAAAGLAAAQAAVERSLAGFKPLSRSALAAAQAKVARDGLPKATAQAIERLGLSPAKVKRAVAALTPDTTVPANLELGPLMRAALEVEIAKFRLIARIPGLLRDARRR